MIVTPKTRGFICTTAHPVGCRENVRRQAEYAKEHCAAHGPKRVLVLGASTGYGLSSRIAAAFGWGASTLGVIFDKPASGSRTASAGWYNTAAFEDYAAQAGLYAKTINGDAFSTQVKEEAIALIRRDLGQVDLVIYSLAAPRRTTADGTTYSSVLKTVGEPYTNKTVDLKTGRVEEVTVTPATQEEIDATVKVMGGEDWLDWMHALQRGGVLAPGAQTVAYSYIGPELTHAIYKDGSIGMANALSVTGAGTAIGELLAGLAGGTRSSLLLYALFFLIPYIATQVMFNRTTMMILTPIVIQVCLALDANPIGPVIVVESASLAAFLSPMATGTVPYYMGLGGYDQKSILKMGAVPTLLCFVVTVVWNSIMFPLF